MLMLWRSCLMAAQVKETSANSSQVTPLPPAHCARLRSIGNFSTVFQRDNGAKSRGNQKEGEKMEKNRNDITRPIEGARWWGTRTKSVKGFSGHQPAEDQMEI